MLSLPTILLLYGQIMQRSKNTRLLFFIVCFLSIVSCVAAQVMPGDRTLRKIQGFNELIPDLMTGEDYRLGPGDVLNIDVRGKATFNYAAGEVTTATPEGAKTNSVTVSPSGDIVLPLIGKVIADGKPVLELEGLIRSRLSEYIRDVHVSVTITKIRTLNIWVSGEVETPGPQVLTAVTTASLAALLAEIKPTGTTRRITVTRNGQTRTIDLYKMTINGGTENDMVLETGDAMHIPAVTEYVDINGEVSRPGRYEMVPYSGETGKFTVGDLLKLSLGVLPSAAKDKAFIERIGDNGKRIAVNVDLSNTEALSGTAMQSGDVLVIPSISAFQPMIRLVGEFKGDGVYQRLEGTTEVQVENKTGIYFLKQGQTVGNVIVATGGVTPQADMKRASIERIESDGKKVSIPVDLDRLLIKSDKSADAVLMNGDSLVLPALADRIYVFGEVKDPRACPYSPSRKLVDYIGDAGGPTSLAKLTSVSVVRNDSKGGSKVTKYDVNSAMRGVNKAGNPDLEPGDIVVVPQKFVSGWRDGIQLIFTSLSLGSLLQRL